MSNLICFARCLSLHLVAAVFLFALLLCIYSFICCINCYRLVPLYYLVLLRILILFLVCIYNIVLFFIYLLFIFVAVWFGSFVNIYARIITS